MLPPDTELIDRILAEDVPYGDLTTQLLRLPDVPARLTVRARGTLVVAGAPFAGAVCERVGAAVSYQLPSGSLAADGETLLVAEGRPDALHQVWKVVANLYENSCGIATRTRGIVDAAAAVGPVEVFATRKVFPGTKPIAVEAVVAGGALPHRLGLSETVLVFDQHTAFLGGLDGLLPLLPGLVRRACEKVVLVEVTSLEQALAVAVAGVGGIQFDKLPPERLADIVAAVRAQAPRVVLIAAGGITAGNAGEFAATGVDALATSWMYAGRADVGVTLEPV